MYTHAYTCCVSKQVTIALRIAFFGWVHCSCTNTHTTHTQFEKGWVIKNTGTKKWKHVCLVHQEGFKPCTPEIVVPEIKPGEKIEVRVRYPAVESQDPDYIKRYTYLSLCLSSICLASVCLSLCQRNVCQFSIILFSFSVQLLEADPQGNYSLWSHPLACCAGGQKALELEHFFLLPSSSGSPHHHHSSHRARNK